MNTNQFNLSQNTHHLQPIQPKPQLIQATAPPLKHLLPPELKPKRLKRERQLKPKLNLKPNLHRDPYPNQISIVTQTQSPPWNPTNTQTTTTNPNPATTETTHHFKPSNHQFNPTKNNWERDKEERKEKSKQREEGRDREREIDREKGR